MSHHETRDGRLLLEQLRSNSDSDVGLETPESRQLRLVDLLLVPPFVLVPPVHDVQVLPTLYEPRLWKSEALVVLPHSSLSPWRFPVLVELLPYDGYRLHGLDVPIPMHSLAVQQFLVDVRLPCEFRETIAEICALRIDVNVEAQLQHGKDLLQQRRDQ